MEVSGTPVPDIRSGFYSSDIELSEAYEDDTQVVIHFYTSNVHDVIEPAIQDVITSPVATRAGFLCSSDVVYSYEKRKQTIDLTGTVVSNVRFTSQTGFRIFPLGSVEAKSVQPKDVRLIILFGSRSWNEDVRGRCARVEVNASFYRNLVDDQETFLARLTDVPVIGGEPVHGNYSASPRGFIVVGSKFECLSILVGNCTDSIPQLKKLREKVEKSASRFVRPKFVGFVFGAFGSLSPHSRHYMTAGMWSTLQYQFPCTLFTGCSTLSVYSGNYPVKNIRNKTLISIMIVEN